MVEFKEASAAFAGFVKSASSVLVSTHLNPDGDALGSALALCHALDQLGVSHELINNNDAPHNLRFLPGVDRLRSEPTRDHDLGIVLDLDAMHRLGRAEPFFSTCKKLVVIDHHIPHEEPGDLRIVDVDAPATAVILYRILKEIGVAMNPSIATCLMAGIVTDTGSFRYRNTTEEALHMTAELLHEGGNLVQIGEEVYGKKPLAGVRLLGRALNNMQLSPDGKVAWSVLGASAFDETGALEQNTEGIVNELLAIQTVQVAALIRQPSLDRKVRASLRSREPYDVAAAAREFGGGGHRNAAGVTFETDIETATQDLIRVLHQCVASS